MADPLPPLPYRPLDVRGHGVYDPATGRFFPFRVWDFGEFLAGKRGISYYIRSASLYAENTGIAAGSMCLVGTMRGYPVQFIRVNVTATTEASGVNQQNASESLIDLLLDPGTGVAHTWNNCTYGGHVMIYAEIPVDEGEL